MSGRKGNPEIAFVAISSNELHKTTKKLLRRNRMKVRSTILTAVMGMTLLFAASAMAQETLLDSVVEGCMTELETYCADVTPGQKRILACLYSRNDKLSGKCEYALYDAAVQLERAIAALTYLVNECADDLVELCADVPAGEGRLLDCLAANEAKVTARCKDAFKEIVME
jgi:hypothetical protein